MSDQVERRRAEFIGRVQGVGFRYSTLGVARSHPVVGYVRNLPNGRVEVVVEGIGTALDAFLSAVADRMAECIEETVVERDSAVGEFETFEIRY